MAVATYAVQVASTVARELQGELCQQGAIRYYGVRNGREGHPSRRDIFFQELYFPECVRVSPF